jgi:hypothetical protein
VEIAHLRIFGHEIGDNRIIKEWTRHEVYFEASRVSASGIPGIRMGMGASSLSTLGKKDEERYTEMAT